MRIDVFTLFPTWFEWFTTQRHVRNVPSARPRLELVNLRSTTPLGPARWTTRPTAEAPAW